MRWKISKHWTDGHFEGFPPAPPRSSSAGSQKGQWPSLLGTFPEAVPALCPPRACSFVLLLASGMWPSFIAGKPQRGRWCVCVSLSQRWWQRPPVSAMRSETLGTTHITSLGQLCQVTSKRGWPRCTSGPLFETRQIQRQSTENLLLIVTPPPTHLLCKATVFILAQ